MGESDLSTPTEPRPTMVGRLATFFSEHPDVWIDGRELMQICGAYAWRSRVSDLRRPPYSMQIENRQRKVVATDGSSYVVSEYRFVTVRNTMFSTMKMSENCEISGEGAASGVAASPAAVGRP